MGLKWLKALRAHRNGVDWSLAFLASCFIVSGMYDLFGFGVAKLVLGFAILVLAILL